MGARYQCNNVSTGSRQAEISMHYKAAQRVSRVEGLGALGRQGAPRAVSNAPWPKLLSNHRWAEARVQSEEEAGIEG